MKHSLIQKKKKKPTLHPSQQTCFYIRTHHIVSWRWGGVGYLQGGGRNKESDLKVER